MKPSYFCFLLVSFANFCAPLQAQQVDFDRDVAPILQEHCWHCHGEDEQESGLRLDRRVGMLRGGDYGSPAVVPGEPEKSFLIEVINHLDPKMKMPPDEDKIPAEQIAVLTRWVKQGAVWPGQMDDVVQEKSDHWSFQPIVRPEVPTVGQEPSARRQARADRMDEILQTVGASALGVTIGCARCHNHKFDPISIRDYYSMSAVFQDIEFGGRFPELAEDHPRRLRGKELYGQIFQLHAKLRQWGPWEEDWTGYRELHFPNTTTKSVRITFTWNSARIDELEIFGTEVRNKNLTLASEGTEAYSPKEMEVLRAELYKFNDGEYGTEGWSGRTPEGSKEKPWVKLTFTEPHEINRIRLSTNREYFFVTDYLQGINKFNFGPYRVEVQNEKGEWKQIAATMQFEQLNKKYKSRAATMQQLQDLIQKVAEEGPKPSFVARFIKPAKTHVLNRGSPESRRDEVFAAGLKELDGDLKLYPDAPGRKRRAAFANWLISTDHPLTARVAANRLWHHIFGQGIVATTGDFGAAGAPPTHPELLDWLAAEMMQPTIIFRYADRSHPWSMKHLIRLMVMSRAFRQSSLPREEGLAVDGNSALLWRFPPKRMEAEVIRDSILQASDSLDRSIGGRSYRIHNVKMRYSQWEVTDNHGPETWRRMIYQERMRRVDDRMFTAFDFPDCGQVRAKRPVSTTPFRH